MAGDIDRIKTLCRERFKTMYPEGNEKLAARMEMELVEICRLKKAPAGLLDIFDRGLKWARNENNIFVHYLLGISDEFDENLNPGFTTPEYPDQDIDYLVRVRNYLKNDFAPKTFGADKVCSIGNYATYGIKMSLIDCTRLHEGDRNEIMSITKPMANKDEEGDVMTWEAALEMYPVFAEWVEKNKDIAADAKALMYAEDVDWPKYGFKGEPPHRVRMTGMHAGGLVVSRVPIAEHVPLIRGKDGVACTAWAEGLHSQDLTLVGQVKLDLLVVDALEKIALTIKLIKERHPDIAKISAKPGCGHWSDNSYRNDPDALKMAAAGDLLGVFQFDSQGIRELVKMGGVTNFEDMVAYASLYRPGCMEVGMHTAYCRRKRGIEKWDVHPLLSFLERSYGIPVYQEDIMKLVNIAGGIPMAEAQPLIKFISKKRVEKIAEYEELFMRNATRILDDVDLAKTYWSSVIAFGGYGFNRSLDESTMVITRDGENQIMKKIAEFSPGDKVLNIDEQGRSEWNEVVAIHDHGVLDGYQVYFDDGHSVVCSIHHKFLTTQGQMPLRTIWETGSCVLAEARDESQDGCDEEGRVIPGTPGHAGIANAGRLVLRKVVRVTPVGRRKMYDLEVSSSTHNFLLSNGVVTSNSHAVGYSTMSMQMLYLKCHFPVEFYTALFSCLKTADDRFPIYRRDAERHSIVVRGLDLNKSKENFSIHGDDIYWGYRKVKGLGKAIAAEIVSSQPYDGIYDFIAKVNVNSTHLKPLVSLGVFSDKTEMENWLFWLQHRKREKSRKASANRWAKRRAQLMEAISAELGRDVSGMSPEEIGSVALEVGKDKKYQAWLKKYCRSSATAEAWRATPAFSWDEFDPDPILDVDESARTLMNDTTVAEIAAYGFEWLHPMKCLPDWEPEGTFDHHDVQTKHGGSWPVDVEIVKVSRCVSKKGSSFTKLEVRDADFRTERMNIWEEDSSIFVELFKSGNILRMLVGPVNPQYNNYNLEPLPGKKWRGKRKVATQREAELDFRVQFLATMETAKEAFEQSKRGRQCHF